MYSIPVGEGSTKHTALDSVKSIILGESVGFLMSSSAEEESCHEINRKEDFGYRGPEKLIV